MLGNWPAIEAKLAVKLPNLDSARLAHGLSASAMRHRVTGPAGNPISELTLGTWGLSGDAYGPVSESTQDEVIERARILGITAFETADVYAAGDMESRLGRVLGSDPTVTFITKLGTDRTSRPARKRFDSEWLRRAVAGSASRLNRSKLDIVLLHNPSAGTLRAGVVADLMRGLVAEGLVGNWGVSAGSADVAEAALNQQVPILQLAFNCFWDTDFKTVAESIHAQGCWVFARSVLAHGLLCGLWPEDKVFAMDDHRLLRWSSDELRRRVRQLDALRPLVHGDVHSLRSVALRWVMCHDEVSTAVIGPRSTQQLDQLVREVGSGPPYLLPQDFEQLEMRLTDLGVRA